MDPLHDRLRPLDELLGSHRDRLAELRFLLDGDMLFLESGGGSGGGDGGSGGSDGDGAPGGDGDGDGDGAPGGDGEKETLTPEQARKLRSEAKNLRQRAKESEEKLAEREKQDLGDKERLEKDLGTANKRIEGLEPENRNLRVRLAAIDVGIHLKRTAAASALVDWNDVDVADEKEIADALKALKKEHEYLFVVENDGAGGRKPADADAGRRSKSGTDATPGMGRLRSAYASKD